MTVSVLNALAMLPSGKPGQPLDWGELGAHLRTSLNTEDEKKRNKRHALRDRLYRDGGDKDMEEVVDAYIADDSLRQKLKRVIPHAKFNNSLKRIVGELSTVYAEPARRFVDGDQGNQERYRTLTTTLCLDEQMDVVNQMLNLHRALIVGPRVRVNPDGTREMVLDIATPATVRALCSPLDTTHVLGWLIKVDMPMVRNPWGRRPEWVLWTDHEQVYLDAGFNPIPETHVEHKLGLNRWVPISYAADAIPGFWPGEEGGDLVAAHLAIWFASVLMIKETKSNTKIPIITGDTSAMARNQAAESEVPIEAPEGVSVTTIDVGTDPTIFITAADHMLARAGNNYGLSMGALTHQGVQSADARELMLAPVRERRRKQTKIFRRFESRLAQVMARVAAVDARDLAFDPAGWRIDFGEPLVVLSEKERLEIFEHRRRLGLTNTVRFLLGEDPDKTPADAVKELEENVEVELSRNQLMRPLQAISGSPGAEMPDAGSDNSNEPGKKPDDDGAATAPVKEAA